ncbi:MAG: hypothetical protein ACP5N3_02595 [Candidatus Nanoarchaeia archaeon]
MNRRTPKEIIEKGNPSLEQAYIKLPGHEPVYVSEYEKEFNTKWDKRKIDELTKNSKHYMGIHTHPYNPSGGEEIHLCQALPSHNDLYSFYSKSKEKTDVIYSKNSKTGEVFGAVMLVKGTENLNSLLLPGFFEHELKKFQNEDFKPDTYYYDLKHIICKKLNWKLRILPATGYYFNVQTGNFEKK